MMDKDAYAADLLMTMLTTGESSRMYRSLVDSQQIAVQVQASSNVREYGGMILLVGIAAPGKGLEAVEQGIDEVISNIVTNGVTDAELQKAKNIAEVEFIGGRTGVYEKALALSNYNRFYKNTQLVNNELDSYLKVTKADIQRVAKNLFAQKNRVVLQYMPVKG